MSDIPLDEMYADLAAADEAGDTELANAIAQKIRIAKGAADAREREQTMRTGFAKVPGAIVEGFKRFGEGLEQLYTAAAEGGWMTRGVPTKPTGSLAAQTSEMNARRLAATGGDPDTEQAADITETGLSMIPGVSALRGANVIRKLPATTTALGAAGRGARQGAIGAALTTGASETAQNPEDVALQRTMAAFFGGGLVGGTQLAAGAGSAIANFWTRLKRSTEKVNATTRELKNAWDLGPLPVSVETGSKLARNMELQVQATKAHNFFNGMYERFASQVDAVTTGVRRFSESPDPSRYETAARVTSAFKKSRAQLQQAASRNYGSRLSVAMSHAAEDGIFVVPFDNLAKVTTEWNHATGGKWWRRVDPGAEKLHGPLAQLDKYLQGGPAKLDVRQLILLRRNLNDLDKGYYDALNSGQRGGPSQEQFAQHRALSDMIDALDADIKAFAASAPPDRPAAKAFAEMAEANEEYTTFKKVQKLTDESTAGQLFGFRVPDDPEKALRMLAEMEPSEQVRTMNILRSADPEAIADIRTALVNDAYTAMLNAPRAASAGRVDPEAWAKSMTGKYGLIGSEIFTPTQMAQFQRGLSTVRLLRDVNEGIISVGRGASIESSVMAAVSRSPAFLSRALLRIGGLGNVEALLFTREGLQSLEVLRNTSKHTPAEVSKAMAKLGAIAGITPEEADAMEGGRQ